MSDVWNSEQFWWYVSRATGVVAWVALLASMLWGIFSATKFLQTYKRPRWINAMHSWLGGLACVFTAGHLAALVADSYAYFGWTEILVPMGSAWKPGYVALGVVSMWLLAAVQFTSLVRKRIPRSWWKNIHLASYLTFWLATMHGVLAGTDADSTAFRWITSIGVTALMLTAIYRVLTRRPPRSATA